MFVDETDEQGLKWFNKYSHIEGIKIEKQIIPQPCPDQKTTSFETHAVPTQKIITQKRLFTKASTNVLFFLGKQFPTRPTKHCQVPQVHTSAVPALPALGTTLTALWIFSLIAIIHIKSNDCETQKYY